MVPTSVSLSGIEVVITRPAGTARSLVRQVRAAGGVPRLLPGLSLRAMPSTPARQAWQAAQLAEVIIFTSPAAVRFALQLAPLRTRAHLLGVGRGTRNALRRAGHADAHSPQEGAEHSEGLLDHPWLQDVRDRRVAVVTAPGGRDLIVQQLRGRGAKVERADVYRRVAPRLTRRHEDMVCKLHASAVVLVTSAQALKHLAGALSPAAFKHLRGCRVVVSSERLEARVREAGFRRIVRADSAMPADLLVAAAAARDGGRA